MFTQSTINGEIVMFFHRSDHQKHTLCSSRQSPRFDGEVVVSAGRIFCYLMVFKSNIIRSIHM